VCVNKLFICILYIVIMGSEQSRSSRSSRSSRGWSRVAPKTISERSALMSKCGRRCFLGSRKTFPICPANGACKVDRRGVAAAYSRAREWASITARKKRTSAHRKYSAVARRARSILYPR
jgi:hypothetical protein